MRLVTCLAFLAFTCCATADTRLRVAPPLQLLNARELHLHADVAFGPLERAWLDEAAAEVGHDTSNVLRVTVTYDTDFSSTLSLVEHRGDSLLCREPLGDSALDGEATDVLGHVSQIDLDRPETWGGPVHVFIVADLLHGPFALKHVAEHEFLHALGLKHVTDDPQAVMWPKVSLLQPTRLLSTCMSRSDAVEACRAYGCDVEQLNYCR